MKLNVTNVEYFGIQRKMVAAMTSESWYNIPHVTFVYEPDISGFFDEYKKINATLSEEDKFTFNTAMLKVITEGLKAAPQMNAHIKYNPHTIRGKITTYENINISMTMILTNGEMMTINLHDFHNKNIPEMTSYIKDVRRRMEQSNLNEAMYTVSFNRTVNTIKQGRVKEAILRIFGAKFGKCKIDTLKGKEKKAYHAIPETERLGDKDIEQGTITISNVGSLDLSQRGETALLEIIPPQVCAICMGAAQDRAVVKTDENGEKYVGIGKILPMTIAFDHRALDFQDIVPFTRKLDYIFTHPESIHEWMK